MKKILFILILCAVFISCSGKNPLGSTPTAPDVVSQPNPVPGDNGQIEITKIENTSIEIKWAAASDDQTPSENLEYKVYYSQNDNIQDAEQAELNGQVAKDWTANITTAAVTGLSDYVMYYFIVVVRDSDANKAHYQSTNAKTSTTRDVTGPTVGTLSSSDVKVFSATLNWTEATDDRTTSANIEYRLIYSTDQTKLTTAESAISNGNTAQNWARGVTSNAVTGLASNKDYHFVLLAKDEAGNVSISSTLAVKTLPFETKIYFQNGQSAYYITDIQCRTPIERTWTVLRTGYPYVNPINDRSRTNITPVYTLSSNHYYIRYRVVSHAWAQKRITGLQPRKVYKIIFYDNTFSLYKLEVIRSY